MSAPLAETGRRVSPGAPAILVLDGAGRHGARHLAGPANTALPTLRPCSPEPDPMESIRRLRLRRNGPVTRVLDNCEPIVAA